jgi:Asp-tRNA(Asn)/Glu-tRNA(Gln) amidotransferase A subunit family amidase
MSLRELTASQQRKALRAKEISSRELPVPSEDSRVDADGLPLDVHLLGRNRRDSELLAPVAQLESAALWDELHPPSRHR